VMVVVVLMLGVQVQIAMDRLRSGICGGGKLGPMKSTRSHVEIYCHSRHIGATR